MLFSRLNIPLINSADWSPIPGQWIQLAAGLVTLKVPSDEAVSSRFFRVNLAPP